MWRYINRADDLRNTKVSARLATSIVHTATVQYAHKHPCIHGYTWTEHAHTRTNHIQRQGEYIEALAWLYSSIAGNIIHPCVRFVGAEQRPHFSWSGNVVVIGCVAIIRISFFLIFHSSNLFIFTHNIVRIWFRLEKLRTNQLTWYRK